VLYQAPLTSSSPGWPVAPPNCQFVAAGYQVANHVCDAPDPTFDNGIISVKVRQMSGSLVTPMSIVFRRDLHVGLRGDYYAFGIDASGSWGFFKTINGRSTPIVPFTPTSSINTAAGATNSLRVRATRSHFVFYVNDVEVGQADDTTFTAGRIGLGAGAGGQAVFNDFLVTTS
jgi:hypothetical protein